MEKKTFLAVILSLLILLGYPRIIAKFFPQYAPSLLQTEQSEQSGKSNSVSQQKKEVEILSNESFPTIVSRPSLPERKKVFTNDNFKITFTNYGGAIEQIELNKYKLNDTPLLLVKPEQGARNMLALHSSSPLFEDKNIVYKEEKFSDNRLIYTANLGEQFQIIKEYFISPEDYSISLEITLKNLTSQSQQFNPILSLSSPITKERFDRRFAEVCFSNNKIYRKNVSGLSKEYTKKGDFSWLGISKKYFCVLLKWSPQGSFMNEADAAHISSLRQKDKKDKDELSESDNLYLNLAFKPFVFYPQQKVSQKFVLYAGPKDTIQLANVDEDFTQVITYGFFSGISRLTLSILRFFYRIVHNYGIAIILLSILINLFLQPLTIKSLKSMKGMQKIQPHLTRLREEHKHNPQRLNEEIRNLFRKHNVNPLGGCLPMILQIPIFIALYQGLARSLELRGASFIFWIKDLSCPDALQLPFTLPLIADKINVLPILMAVAMGWQQKMSVHQKEKREISETEKHQQKMALIMPLIFALIFYSMPSGLVLYWLTNTLITIFYQRKIH
ncbi:MAG: membrane protein insertase YidC [Candidatus Omnitrophica bacterium]|nr:membrane protein insertase YidC [Candidatus Omnitrophota bacterium]